METLCATGHRHTTSVAQQDGPSTDSTWTDDGKRRLFLSLFHTDRFNRRNRVAFGMLWVDQHIDRLSQFHVRTLRDICTELVRRIGPGSVHSVTMPMTAPVGPSTSPHAPKAPSYPDGLTARVVEVLGLVAQGLKNEQVAEQLVISPRTVNSHLTSIFSKIGISSREVATRYAIEHNLA